MVVVVFVGLVESGYRDREKGMEKRTRGCGHEYIVTTEGDPE